RRRHTRLQGDWSSDVCSSDLSLYRAQLSASHESLDRTPHLSRGLPAELVAGHGYIRGPRVLGSGRGKPASTLRQDAGALAAALRSEERRVGKEWRARWWPEHG